MTEMESMFCWVRVPEEEGNLNSNVEEYRMKVHLFSATSSPSCAPYTLRRTAEDGTRIFSAEAVDTVLRNVYVDDCLKAVETSEQAVKQVQELKDLCTRGGFHLTKWVNNSRTVLLSIPDNEKAPAVKNLDLTNNTLPMDCALGVHQDVQWCTETDRFSFEINIQNKAVTKCGILSTVSAVFDPLGFLVPLILPAKLILRDLCKNK